jgi:adenine-specific DNA-methyltransferase
MRIARHHHPEAPVVLHKGDCLPFLRSLPPESVMLALTSPPYNLGKSYELRSDLGTYLAKQRLVITELARIVHPKGSVCWQVGNHVRAGQVYPIDSLVYRDFIDSGFRLRNRVIWHFEHGLHCTTRFSGRYETICWFTKSDEYKFYLDRVRVPQKYPGKKHYKGPKKGQFSSNPNGQNPGDVWAIPNVKHNHPEKTQHPCQFPLELAERLILALTDSGDLVCDPYMGSGTTVAAAILHKRRAAGSDILGSFVEIAQKRARLAANGKLPRRTLGRPVYVPPPNTSLTTRPWDKDGKRRPRGE